MSSKQGLAFKRCLLALNLHADANGTVFFLVRFMVTFKGDRLRCVAPIASGPHASLFRNRLRRHRLVRVSMCDLDRASLASRHDLEPRIKVDHCRRQLGEHSGVAVSLGGSVGKLGLQGLRAHHRLLQVGAVDRQSEVGLRGLEACNVGEGRVLPSSAIALSPQDNWWASSSSAREAGPGSVGLRETTSLSPRSQLEIIVGGENGLDNRHISPQLLGHWLMEENPKQTVDLVTAFLKSGS